MSGHSKFANIRHKKEKMDSMRGKIFTRLGREIAVAVKFGGPDPSANSRLKDIVAKAKSENMPNDTIDRSIKKAAGDLNAVNYENITYEGYGPKGVAVIVEVLTDNRNRAAANVRNAFTKGGGNMGNSGCVAFLFDQKGLILVENGDTDEDELMLLAMDAEAEDFTATEDGFEITTTPETFSQVRETIENAGVKPLSAQITMLPQTIAELTEPDDIKKMNKLLDLLDEEDDVQNVYHNGEWET